MHAYRILAMVSMLATLATIGSFILDLWHTVRPDKASEPSKTADHQAPKVRSVPAPIRDTPLREAAGCDLEIYEPIRQRLRGEKGEVLATGADRFERLGENKNHIFVYDFANDTIACIARPVSSGPIVFGQKAEGRNVNRYEVIFGCCVAIVLASLLLVAVKVSRWQE